MATRLQRPDLLLTAGHQRWCHMWLLQPITEIAPYFHWRLLLMLQHTKTFQAIVVRHWTFTPQLNHLELVSKKKASGMVNTSFYQIIFFPQSYFSVAFTFAVYTKNGKWSKQKEVRRERVTTFAKKYKTYPWTCARGLAACMLQIQLQISHIQ